MRLNRTFIFFVFIISIMGLLTLYSATLSISGIYFIKQFLWFSIGFTIMFLMALVKPKYYYKFSVPVYILSIILLIVVMFFSYSGVHRWISIAGIRLQPSEFAKFALIMVLAAFVQRRKFDIYSHKDALSMILLSILPAVLVLIEPDLGTSTVFFVILIGIMIVMGMDIFLIFMLIFPIFSVILFFNKYLWIIFVLIVGYMWFRYRKDKIESIFVLLLVIISGVASSMVWNHLKDYQKNRIISFINPSRDPLGAGWHILQSEIAIGSGGILGKGFAQGTQKGLNFIPEHHTDFIFSTIGEEFGFIGSIFVISILFSFVIYLFYKSYESKSKFASTVIAGYAILFIYQVIVNIGMVLGLLPVVGLPLPFFSYGGSSALLFFGLSGVVLSILSHKYEDI